jgi:hypothetical protein
MCLKICLCNKFILNGQGKGTPTAAFAQMFKEVQNSGFAARHPISMVMWQDEPSSFMLLAFVRYVALF